MVLEEGIEPSRDEYKSSILPLYYSSISTTDELPESSLYIECTSFIFIHIEDRSEPKGATLGFSAPTKL